MMIKVLEPIGFTNSDWIRDLKKKFAVKIEEIDSRNMTDETLISHIHDANALVLSNRPLSKKVLLACPNLQFIAVSFAGIDHIDQEIAKEKNILIKNAAGYATHAVSELVIALALELYRKISLSTTTLTKEKAHLFPLGKELFGKKVGIIGEGSIGKQTASLFSAFGCEVVCYKRGSSSLEDILKTSDILSLHIPLTNETRHFIDERKLSLMKPSSIIINTARGPIIDQKALITALTQNKIAGAALDVFDQEPPLPSSHPLLRLDNVLLTPHIGYRTEEAIRAKAELTLKNLENWLQ